MSQFIVAVMQAAAGAETSVAAPGWWQWLVNFVDTPAPYSPFSEYLLVLFVLWLMARRDARKQGDFGKQAQEVLDEKFKAGEISEQAYHKFRQDISLRPKH
ncbi:MAG: hypothetical protein ACYC28_15560 [Longimicrobiales bacterium]